MANSLNKIKLVVADDHPGFCEGVCRSIADEADMEVIATSSNGEETVLLAKRLHPDVVVIDVAMPKLTGIEAAKQIKATCQAKILMISAYDYPSYILASLQAGASGYLLKTTPLRELISAIRMVLLGKLIFDFNSSSLVSYLNLDGNVKERNLGTLHNRELDVLKRAARGISNKQIAIDLGLSERTIQSHFVNIFRKLGVSSRTEAVLRGLKMGWFTPDELP